MKKFKKYKEQGSSEFATNFLRHYYDISQLLGNQDVFNFIGTTEYLDFKSKVFRTQSDSVKSNEAFLLSDPEDFVFFEKKYEEKSSLYYKDKKTFTEIMTVLREHADKL